MYFIVAIILQHCFLLDFCYHVSQRTEGSPTDREHQCNDEQRRSKDNDKNNICQFIDLVSAVQVFGLCRYIKALLGGWNTADFTMEIVIPDLLDRCFPGYDFLYPAFIRTSSGRSMTGCCVRLHFRIYQEP